MSPATAKPVKKRPDKPAKAKRKTNTGNESKATADEALERYNDIFGEIQRFVSVIESSESELSEPTSGVNFNLKFEALKRGLEQLKKPKV